MTKKIHEFEDNVRFQDVDESKNESYYWVDGVLYYDNGVVCSIVQGLLPHDYERVETEVDWSEKEFTCEMAGVPYGCIQWSGGNVAVTGNQVYSRAVALLNAASRFTNIDIERFRQELTKLTEGR